MASEGSSYENQYFNLTPLLDNLMATMLDDPTYNMAASTVSTIPSTNVGDGYNFGNVGQNVNAPALLSLATGAYVSGVDADTNAVPSYGVAYHPFSVPPYQPVCYPPPPLQAHYPVGVPYGPGAVPGVYSYTPGAVPTVYPCTPYFYGGHHPSGVIAHESYPPLGASGAPSHPTYCPHASASVAATSQVRRRV